MQSNLRHCFCEGFDHSEKSFGAMLIMCGFRYKSAIWWYKLTILREESFVDVLRKEVSEYTLTSDEMKCDDMRCWLISDKIIDSGHKMMNPMRARNCTRFRK
jgi:hypothetical protein